MDLVTVAALGALHAVGRVSAPRAPDLLSLNRVVAPERQTLMLVSDDHDKPPTRLSPIDRWRPYIAEAAQRFALSEHWIRTVMRAESGGHSHLSGQPTTSRAGAMGLMQVMPETYAAMRLRLGLGANPYDPHDNVLAGAAYLREMYDRYGYPGLFAAYNAGPARFDAYLTRTRPLPEETWIYLAAMGPDVQDRVRAQGAAPLPRRVVRASPAPQQQVAASSGTTLFFTLGPLSAATRPASIGRPADPNGARLFVPLGIRNGARHAADDGDD